MSRVSSSREEGIERGCPFCKVVAGTNVDEVLSGVVVEIDDEERRFDDTARLLGNVHPNFAVSEPSKRNRSRVTTWARNETSVGPRYSQSGVVVSRRDHRGCVSNIGLTYRVPRYANLAAGLMFRNERG
jgi:hypothetical protein